MHTWTQRIFLFGVCTAMLALGTPKEAQAISGLYLQLGVGYGITTGRELILTERPGVANDLPQAGEECCPPGGLGAQFRLGFSIFGFGGPEVGIFGNGWNLGNDNQGGIGVVGGGIRIFPLKFIGLFTGLDTKKFPIDVGMGFLVGYAVAGQDFFYEGTAVDIDLHVDWKVTSFMAIGVKFDAMFPSFGNFVFTSYKNRRGRCYSDQLNPPDGLGGGQDKDAISGSCNNQSPSTTVLSPQLLLTFYFDVLDV